MGKQYISQRYLIDIFMVDMNAEVQEIGSLAGELHCFVCPLWPSFSYLRQDFRVVWGLLAVFVLSVFMFGGLRMMHFY